VDDEVPHLSNYRGCRHAKEEKRKRKSQRAPKSTRGRVFSSSHTTPELPFAAVYAATHSNSRSLGRPQLHRPATLQWEKLVPPPLRHNQQQVPGQSVQAPNANSSSVNDMFTVVATIFQQIVTDLNGVESEEERIVAITKIVFKLMKQDFIGGECDCAGKAQQQL
jgi:hypothetical protein